MWTFSIIGINWYLIPFFTLYNHVFTISKYVLRLPSRKLKVKVKVKKHFEHSHSYVKHLCGVINLTHMLQKSVYRSARVLFHWHLEKAASNCNRRQVWEKGCDSHHCEKPAPLLDNWSRRGEASSWNWTCSGDKMASCVLTQFRPLLDKSDDL